MMPNFNSIGSGVSEPQVAEYHYLPNPNTLTTVYALTYYTVMHQNRDFSYFLHAHSARVNDVICIVNRASTLIFSNFRDPGPKINKIT